MRTLAFLGLAASLAVVSAPAESAPGRTVGARDWSGVPTIPLRPPVAGPTAPSMPAPGATGNWSSGGGWRGRGGWNAGPGTPHMMTPGHPGGGWQRWRARGGHGDRGFSGRFHPRPGLFIPRVFVSPTFFVSDWWSFGLYEPGFGRRWVRHYDDAVLIDDRGYIYDTAPDVDWYGDAADGYHDGYDDWAPPYYALRTGGPGVYYAPPGSTTVIIQNPSVVTTTTTTTYVDEVVHRSAGRAWKPRSKLVKARPCNCK